MATSNKNQYCSKNIASTSNAENAVSDPLLITYGQKSIELKVMKDILNMYQNSLSEKETMLKEENRKLDTLNYQVWSLEDSFCNQVWQFSRENDFSIIFKHYPFIVETGHCKKQNNYKDVEGSSELIDLINEIDLIKAEIFSFNRNRKNLKEDVECALVNLKKLQLLSDEVTELLKLMSSPESLSKRVTTISIPDEIMPNHTIRQCKKDSNYEDLKNQKGRGSQKESSWKHKSNLKNDKSSSNKKQVIATSKNYPQLPLEKSIIFSTRTIMTTIANVPMEIASSEKFKNFTPKKRSQISIRFEQYRERKQ